MSVDSTRNMVLKNGDIKTRLNIVVSTANVIYSNVDLRLGKVPVLLHIRLSQYLTF